MKNTCGEKLLALYNFESADGTFFLTHIMEFLLENSPLVKELARNGPVTMEELFTCYCSSPEDLATTIANVHKLAAFAVDEPQFSRCIIDRSQPYASLEGLTRDELGALVKLADYLQLPEHFERQIEEVARLGTKMSRYKAILDWEDENDCKFNQWNVDHWIELVDLEGIKYVVEEGDAMLTAKNLWNTFNYTRTDITKYVYENLEEKPAKTEQVALYAGTQVELLKFLYDEGYPMSNMLLYNAIGQNSIDCLKFGYDCGCRFNYEPYNINIRRKLDTLSPEIREFVEKYLPLA